VWNGGSIIEKYNGYIYMGEEILGIKETHNLLLRTL
jgi:hypothetical protein